MPVSIPESHKQMLEKPVYAKLATLMPDGRPQVHPVWCDFDGTHLRINSAKGRQKDRNLRDREYATVLLIDSEDPYYWMEIRGRVADIVEGDEAEDHIDKLAKKYLGAESYPMRKEGEVRVMYKLEPERVLSAGEEE